MYECFKNLSEKESNSFESQDNFPGMTDQFGEVLDQPILVEELKTIIIRLKLDKAADIDCIIPEVFRKLNNYQLEVIVNGNVSKRMAIGIIVPIFKKGTTSDLNNYRGITLLSVSGKLLTGILNARLEKVVNTFSALEENQAGFHKGYRTTDHIFILHAIITHFVHADNRKLYACFKKHLIKYPMP